MMRRSPMKPSGPLKQSAFKRSERKEADAVAKLRKPMKSSRPKMTPIRKAARGQDCAMQITGVCNRNPETTVWAHSNNYADGKGAGIKARDEEGCFACHACHSFYDGGYAAAGWTREAAESAFNAARERSREILRQKGLIA